MIIKLFHNKNLYLRTLKKEENYIFSEEEFLNKIINLYHETCFKYGNEPYKIVYGRGEGYYLQATSYVGIIKFDDITMVIEPSIPGLDIGKILYLQASVNDESNSKGKELFEIALENDLTLNSVDYYLISFLDILDTLVNNGLITSIKQSEYIGDKIKGRLNIKKQIINAPAYDKFYSISKVKSNDIILNQILLKALLIAKETSRLTKITNRIDFYIKSFDNVSIRDIEHEDFLNLLNEYSSLKREDYEKALIIAEHIIFGFDPTKGENYSLFPEYLLNLNEIFEKYVIKNLENLFKTGMTPKYNLSLGINHNNQEPKIDSNRFIELDGFYKQGEFSLVVDAKNKYTFISEERNSFLPSNPDLFQQYYYCVRTGAKHVILVYPSDVHLKKPTTKFDIQHVGTPKITFICWHLYISGKPKENYAALVSLAKYIDKLSKENEN